MIRRIVFGILAVAVAAGASAQTSPAPLMFYAGQPGRLTQDRDVQGGNPFASALVEVLKSAPKTLKDFTALLAASNARHSGGWQQLQFPKALPNWRIGGEGRRVALVLINADYSKSSGVYSLPGAAFDAKRIPKALIDAGFETDIIVDASAEAARKAMAAFSEKSASADAALIYVGGHGIQHRRVVYWMMGDYPEQDPKWLPTHAFSLEEIAKAARARSVNLVLYASCRDDPFLNK